MKAWSAVEDYEGYEVIIFAETAGKAKAIAKANNLFENYKFTEIKVRRCPTADKAYRGEEFLDFAYNETDRLFAVTNLGWYCDDESFDPDGDCPKCCAREFCDRYKDYKEENK